MAAQERAEIVAKIEKAGGVVPASGGLKNNPPEDALVERLLGDGFTGIVDARKFAGEQGKMAKPGGDHRGKKTPMLIQPSMNRASRVTIRALVQHRPAPKRWSSAKRLSLIHI